MNLKNAAALIRNDITTICGEHLEQTNHKKYTYKILRTLAQQLSPGDMVLVRNIRGICIFVVEKVYSEPKIDIHDDDSQGYRWAFQIVDTATVNKLEAQDELIYERLQEHQRSTTRQQVLGALGMTQDEINNLLENEDE